MTLKGEIIPGSGRVRRVLPAGVREGHEERRLSRTARGRLRVLRWSEAHGGAVRATCERFGLSTSTFLLWRRRYREGQGWRVSASMVGRILTERGSL